MMTKPGITELDRCVDSRYTLVSMVAKRARMIGKERKQIENDQESNVVLTDEKPVSQAVEEIASGVVGYVRSEAIQKAREYEEEKFEAISQLEQQLATDSEKQDEDIEDNYIEDDKTQQEDIAAENQIQDPLSFE